jgi:hypothetical protein
MCRPGEGLKAPLVAKLLAELPQARKEKEGFC